MSSIELHSKHRPLATTVAWLFAKMTYVMPKVFYVEIFPQHRHKPAGPGNIKGMRLHPKFVDRILRKAGITARYTRSSQF